MSTAAVCTTCSQDLKKEWNLKSKDDSLEFTQEYQQASGHTGLASYFCQRCWTDAISRLPPSQTLREEQANLMKQIRGSKQEIDLLVRTKEMLEEQNSNLRTESSNLTERTIELEQQYRELENKMIQLQNEVNGLSGQKERFEEEKKAIDREKRRLNIHENKQILQFREDKINSGDFENCYDCRILADSFYSLLQNKSWEIKFKDNQEYESLKLKNTTKVAVLGYENSGKSFVLSKLTGSELPQGTLIKTTGICMQFPKEKYLPWIALDTPGTNISVKTQKMREDMRDYFETKNLSEEERMRLLLGDNILMENLLQEFVVKHAQVLLVVVGKLHRDDQRLINRIKKLPGKRIMIVHNLLDVQNKEDVEKIIQEDICQTFSVTEKPFYLEKIEIEKAEGMNTKVYLESLEYDDKNDKNEKAIEHIVMAHEGSPAGKYYNESAINYIKTTITSVPFVKPFDLVVAFREFLNENLKNYLSFKNTSEKPNHPFILENEESGAPKAIRLNDPSPYELKLSMADEFGQIRTFAREGLENVFYTVKIVPQETDFGDGVKSILKVEFEIVGKYEDKNITCRVHLVNNRAIIEIRGKSEDNTIRGEKELILENHRKFGEFTIRTDSIDLEKLVINPREKCQRISTEVPGLMIFAWNLYEPAEDTW